jgi:hypothetical protein
MSLPGLDLRDGVQGLVGYARRDLSVLWREAASPAGIRVALSDVLPALIDTYGVAASTLAADWYDGQREVASVRRAFRAIPATVPDQNPFALIGWALDQAKDDQSLRGLIEGGMQRRIADYSRLTVMGSAVQDPAAVGWQRTGGGDCHFCDMLIARGAVYSEASADFAAHDNCRCSAVPAFGGRPQPVKAYTPSTRDISDADRARVRAYIDENY